MAEASDPSTSCKPDRSKKTVKRRGAKQQGNQQELSVNDQHVDMVRLVRSERKAENAEEDSPLVLLSLKGKAAQLHLSEDKLTVSGNKGYRTVRATHGVHQGAWYCEFTIKNLGSTGHARLGWVTKKAELQAPAGFDEHGFCYRDVEGSKVHQGRREPYGSPFKEGDVVGLLIHLPEGGRPIELRERKVVRYKGTLYYEDEPEATPKPLVGSSMHFTVNGEPQGAAYTDLNEGTYYPAVSLYTMPEQVEGAMVSANFGPNFAFPLPLIEGLPEPRPISAHGQPSGPSGVQIGSAAAAGVGAAPMAMD